MVVFILLEIIFSDLFSQVVARALAGKRHRREGAESARLDHEENPGLQRGVSQTQVIIDSAHFSSGRHVFRPVGPLFPCFCVGSRQSLCISLSWHLTQVVCVCQTLGGFASSCVCLSPSSPSPRPLSLWAPSQDIFPSECAPCSGCVSVSCPSPCHHHTLDALRLALQRPA